MSRTRSAAFACVAVVAAATTAFGLTFDQVRVEDWAASGLGAGEEAMCIVSFPDGYNAAFGYRFDRAHALTRPPSQFASTYGFDVPADKAEAMLLALDDQTSLDVLYHYHDIYGFGVDGFTCDGHLLDTDGWITTFPGYWVSGMPEFTDFFGTTHAAWEGDGQTWLPGELGPSTRTFQNGDWDGWTKEYIVNGFIPVTEPTVPLQPIIPEPASLVLVALGCVALGRRYRRAWR